MDELERENAELRARLAEAALRDSEAADRADAADLRSADWRRTSKDHERDAASLRASEEQLRQLADAMPHFVSFIDAQERYQLVNRTYEAWFDRPRESILGRTIREVLGEEAYAVRRDHIAAALRGEPARFEAATPRADGALRETEMQYLPRRAEDGGVDGFYAVVTDITERRTAERATRRSEARLRLAIDAGRMAIWELDVANDALVGSPELNRLLGFPEDSDPALNEIRARYLPGERDRMREVMMKALEAGERYAEVDFRLRWPDGSVRWLLIRAEIHLSPQGEPTKVVGVLLDVTERKRAEERQNLLLHEIAHRVKNTLATVLALATLTARTATDVGSFRDKLIDRVQGMAKTHDILTGNNWEGAALRDVVANELGPYDDEAQRKVVLKGPPVDLTPRAAVALGMMMHELTTNAAKYGALSAPRGRIEVAWSLDEAGETPRLDLTWEESGGPPARAPQGEGFGSTLIKRGLARELDAKVSFDFRPEGLRFRLSMPLPPRQAGTGLNPWRPGSR